MTIGFTAFASHLASGIFFPVGGIQRSAMALWSGARMSQQHLSEAGSVATGPDSTRGESTERATGSAGWPGGTPPLPASLLWSAVGDLDVIERLSRHAHQVLFPAGLCSHCGQAWPCEPARADLLLDLGWVKLAIYCAVLMERAAKDLPSLGPKELWQRFLEWTEPQQEIHDPLLRRIA